MLWYISNGPHAAADTSPLQGRRSVDRVASPLRLLRQPSADPSDEELSGVRGPVLGKIREETMSDLSGLMLLFACLAFPPLFCSRGGLIARGRALIRYEDLEISPSGTLRFREPLNAV